MTDVNTHCHLGLDLQSNCKWGDYVSKIYKKACARMGGGRPNVCTTSDFRAVLFWFVYGASAVRRPALAVGVSLEGSVAWLSTGEGIFWKYWAFRSCDRFDTTTWKGGGG